MSLLLWVASFVSFLCQFLGLFYRLGVDKQVYLCSAERLWHLRDLGQGLVLQVGRGNKFVLLDMTEEPEAKKAYSIQHKRNLMER